VDFRYLIFVLIKLESLWVTHLGKFVRQLFFFLINGYLFHRLLSIIIWTLRSMRLFCFSFCT